MNLKREFKVRVRREKLNYYNDLNTKLNNVCNPKEFWEVVKKYKKGSRTDAGIIGVHVWNEYLRKSYPIAMPSSITLFDTFHPLFDVSFSNNEIRSAVNKLKLAKAPGPDSTPNEFYKHLPDNGLCILRDMCNGYM